MLRTPKPLLARSPAPYALLGWLALLSCSARAHAAPLGQWVWSRADLSPLTAARALRPDLGAAVHVAELRVQGQQLKAVLRLSPNAARAASAVAIRFDASFHAAWALPEAELIEQTAAALQRVLSLVRQTAPHVTSLQLDYDCPTPQLARWAELLRALSGRGVLWGFEVWTTSLIAQLRSPQFGALFSGLVAGHIVQVFDTGEVNDARARAELLRLLARADLPFCLGLGAFERATSHARATDHRAWWPVAGELARSPRFRGTWIFAAGRDWAELIGGLP